MPNKHFVHLDWFRTEFDLAYGFSPNWDIELDIPYDVKTVSAKYELPDGTPFDNPEGDLHHRDERLQGLSDLKLLANYRPGGVLMKDDRLHVGIGLSLPTGRTEGDPWKLGNQGSKHQHIQFGTGTVDPVVRLDYYRLADPIGFLISTNVQIPLYENRRTYKGSTQADFAVGPRVRFSEWLVVGASYVASYQTRSFWDGDPDQNSGYFLQGVGFNAAVRLAPRVTLIPTVLRVHSIETRGSSDSLKMDWLVGLSLDLALGGGGQTDE
ncbi:MAG: hypothetical protein EHM91_03915 [Planctomycetota bacterium]|nr:MAG: hypothetical protein EHM91_03915 [Planctomycetota bacterium]